MAHNPESPVQPEAPTPLQTVDSLPPIDLAALAMQAYVSEPTLVPPVPDVKKLSEAITRHHAAQSKPLSYLWEAQKKQPRDAVGKMLRHLGF